MPVFFFFFLASRYFLCYKGLCDWPPKNKAGIVPLFFFMGLIQGMIQRFSSFCHMSQKYAHMD